MDQQLVLWLIGGLVVIGGGFGGFLFKMLFERTSKMNETATENQNKISTLIERVDNLTTSLEHHATSVSTDNRQLHEDVTEIKVCLAKLETKLDDK